MIIGGHRKKTEKVLLHLRRMYMPLQNYKDLEPEFLMGYWAAGKDIIAVTHFADLIPEVVALGGDHDEKRNALVDMRIRIKSQAYHGVKHNREMLKKEIVQGKKELRKILESEILNRLKSIKRYLLDVHGDRYLAHEKIFEIYDAR